jgi:hypothetical protein
MQPDPNQMMHFFMVIFAFYAFLILLGLTAVIIPTWFICKKAGFSPWLSFLNLIFPIGGLILLYLLAFADWKVVPAPQAFWPPQPPNPPQPPYPPQMPPPPQG